MNEQPARVALEWQRDALDSNVERIRSGRRSDENEALRSFSPGGLLCVNDQATEQILRAKALSARGHGCLWRPVNANRSYIDMSYIFPTLNGSGTTGRIVLAQQYFLGETCCTTTRTSHSPSQKENEHETDFYSRHRGLGGTCGANDDTCCPDPDRRTFAYAGNRQ